MKTNAPDLPVPRQVFASRRVTLPTKTARRVLASEASSSDQPPKVVWSVSDPASRTAVVRVAEEGADLARVRQVTSVWQVPIPVPVMTDLALDVLEWVYIGVAEDQRGLTVTPARGIRLVAAGRQEGRS